MTTVNAIELIEPGNQLRLQFLTALRKKWSTDVYSQLADDFRKATEESGVPRTREEAAEIIESCPTYPWFGWLERDAQKMKWRVITDVVDKEWDKLSEPLAAPAKWPAKLAPDLDLPDWYEDWDIHCQPGGVWSDLSSALVYELGTKVLHIGKNSKLELHHLFTKTAVEERPYRRIVDLGCGFGKSTLPFKERFPDAEVIGVDLSGPCVTLAAARASQAGIEVSFRQGNATETGLADASVTLATSTMLFHEMPVTALREMLQEVARILEPGGTCRFLDFMRTGDVFRDAVMNHHSLRNNEPFMPGSMDFDIEAEFAKVGMINARWTPFDERGAGVVGEFPARGDWHFPWAVLSADKPLNA